MKVKNKSKEKVSVEELERSLNELEALTDSASPSASDEDEDEVEYETESASDDEDDDEEDETVAAASDDDDDDSEELEASDDIDDDDEDEEPVTKSARGKSKKKLRAKKKADVDDDADEDMEESLRSRGDELYAEEPVMKAVDISPFIESLVEKNAEILDDLTGELREARGQNKQIMKAFAKSFRGIAESIQALDERLSNLESSPAPKRGRVTVLERSMGGAADQPQNKTPQLSKAMVSDALEALNKEPETSPRHVADFDVVRFETSGVMTPAVQKKVIDYWTNGSAQITH